MRYAIGLDVGIKSVGFSVMELDYNDEPYRIEKLGSRIFDAAEQPKTGESLAAPRRAARGLRRRIRRHRHRNERVRNLLVNSDILTQSELDTLFNGKLSDIYYLRTKALDERLTNLELARVLINLSQRRGFKSNRKAEDEKEEGGKLLKSVRANDERMKQNAYRTIGEMFFKDIEFAENKRNKPGENAYKSTVSRADIEAEIDLILTTQKALGNELLTDEFIEKYKDIVLSQRDYSQGPGYAPDGTLSPYGGNLVERMIGQCTLIPEEKRAVKASYSLQYFKLLQAINNIKIISNSETRKLTPDERKKIEEAAFKTKSFTNYSKIRKLLNLGENELFNISYGNKTADEVEKKTKFDYLSSYHKIKSAVGEDLFSQLSIPADLNNIGYILSVYNTDEDITKHLTEADIDSKIIEPLLKVTGISGTGHISVKACDMLIPYLKEGKLYNEACEFAGLCEASRQKLDDITNPVVKRAVTQTLKVIKAIRREMGNDPVYINIELAREMSKDFEERKKIEKAQKENAEYNEKIVKRLEEDFGITNPTGINIVKLKLWDEQKGICMYSGEPLKAERLFEDDGYCQVDHIIPYSISFDDSYNNKVLVKTAENQHKGNRLPLEYMSEEQTKAFRVRVGTTYSNNMRKRSKLLKEKITKEDRDSFKERNLNDTKYISRFLLNYLKDNITFEEFNTDKKIHVHAVNGAVTGFMRKRWGIQKVRANGDMHHAVDASVIACITPTLIKRASKYSEANECAYGPYGYSFNGRYIVDNETGEAFEKFPLPYPCFVDELWARVNPNAQQIVIDSKFPNYTVEDIERIKAPFVSRMTRHKVTGQVNEATVVAQRQSGKVIQKTELSKLELDKDGEIKYYYNWKSDKPLYYALQARLKEYGGNAKEAFKEPFYKPKSDGSQGPLVKKVKLEKTNNSVISVRKENRSCKVNSVVPNGSMIRVDVFYVENEGYYLVPIYVADTLKKDLPNIAITKGKDCIIMEDKDFVFSLYPNDLIRIIRKKQMNFTIPPKHKGSTLEPSFETNDIMVYYNSTDSSDGRIVVETIDDSYFSRVSSRGLDLIEKYTVDVLGNYTKVKKEKRMGFTKR